MLREDASKPSITKLSSIASKRRSVSDEIQDQDEYSNMTKSNLKVACGSKLLPVSGNVTLHCFR